MTSILNYVIKHIVDFDTINKKRDNIITNVNVRIKTIFRNYKIDMQFVDRSFKIAF